MKFTDGYWQHRPEYTLLYAVEVDDIRIDHDRGELVVSVATGHITGRGDTLNRPETWVDSGNVLMRWRVDPVEPDSPSRLSSQRHQAFFRA